MGTTCNDAPVSLAALSDGDPGTRPWRDDPYPPPTLDWDTLIRDFIRHEKRTQRVLDLRRAQRACDRESARLGEMGYVGRLRAMELGEALSRYARLDRAVRQ
jgi:hypothetical protein